MAESVCMSTESINQFGSLYSRADQANFDLSIVAMERMCAYQRTRHYSQCFDQELHQLMDRQLKICDQNSEQGQALLQQARERCGRLTFQSRMPDCPKDEYSFPSCRQFEGFVDLSTQNQCLVGNIAPDIASLRPLAEEMTRSQRESEVLEKLKQNLVTNFEKGLGPLESFQQCLEAELKGSSAQEVNFNGAKVSCSKMVEFLMAKVMMNLPLLRQHQILSHGPAFRERGRDIRDFKNSLNRAYPQHQLSDEEIRRIGENVDLNMQDLPIGRSPKASLEELKLAAEIRSEEFNYRDQQFLEANRNKDPFKECVAEVDGQLQFVSYASDVRKAMECGKYEARDDAKISNTIFTAADELNMADASKSQAFDALLSYRLKVRDQHREAMTALIEENRFLAHMNMQTEDLPSDNDPENVQLQKRNNILRTLLGSFGSMVRTARDEIAKVRNETDTSELRSLLIQNPELVEESIKNQPNLDKRTCDTLESLLRTQKVSNRTSSALRVTASLIGGLACPFTWGAGCVLAAAVQVPHVRELNRVKNRALAEFFTGQKSIEEYVEAEWEHMSSKAFLAMEFIGVPLLGPSKLLVRSAREASRMSRVAGATGRAGAVLDQVPRASFGTDITQALQVSKQQGNVELFTVHGMGSSHSAIRVGDTVYHTGQGFGKSIGSSIPGAKGDFVAEPFETFLAREIRANRAVEGITLRVSDTEMTIIRGNAERMAESGARYSLMRANCSQTVCDIVTQNGARTVDVDRTFDPLMLRNRLNESLGDKAISQNIYGNEAKLGSSSRRRYLLSALSYSSGLIGGEALTNYFPE